MSSVPKCRSRRQPLAPPSHQPTPDLRDERGFGLLAALLVMLMISVMGASMVISGRTDIATSDNYRAAKAALYEADSGLELTKADFLSDITWIPALVDGSTLPLSAHPTFPTSLTINGHTVSVPVDAGGNPVAQYYDIGGTTVLGDGSFTRQVLFPNTSFALANGKGSKAWVVFPVRATGAAGQAAPATQRVAAELRVMVFRVAIWDNAIFAGTGQAGAQINGNVEVRGSVHVVGDPNNPTLLDWSGGSAILNNYDGVGDNSHFGADAVRLPPLPTRWIDGEQVATLDAEMRVKNGTVELDGSAQMGQANVTGNTHKELLDGIYTENPVQFGSGSAATYADEEGDYDISINVPFPTLDDPYTEPTTGTTYPSHRDYLNAEALTVAVNNLDDTTPSFSFSDAAGNSMSWDLTTQTVTIDGVVRIDGDLAVGRQGGSAVDRIVYEGTGTIYATDDISIVWDVIPAGDYLDLNAPTVNNLGLIADDDLSIGKTSQLKIMAAVYAEDEMLIDKQTILGGAVVADFFNMGSQVPSIFQVPRLGGNLPPAMPGADPILVPSQGDLANWTHARQ